MSGALAFGLFALIPRVLAADAGLEFFESKVRPLLIERCYECHADKKQKGGLRLDSKHGWQQGGDSGTALIPGRPDASLLIKAVSWTDKDLEMPPKQKLSDAEIAVLTQWVAMGAPDPRESTAVSGAQTGLSLDEGRKFWAMIPPKPPAIPEVKRTDWARTDIDRFVLAKLEAAKLAPSPPAEPLTLLRRLTFDLTGLPPTPEEMDTFLKDCSADGNASDSAVRIPPSAVERVVDRLLASRAFAERWARHWLDLAGYADTIEIGRAIPAPNAWRYRDYVINAVHADKPYDQFIREQIAGDLMGGDSPEQIAERIIATGFLALGPWELVNGDKTQLRMDVVDRQVNRIGLAMLGMTFACARCHDHKFDPVSQADYYALAGIFKSTITLHGRLNGVFSAINETPLPETPAQLIQRAKQFEDFEKRLADAKAQSQSLATNKRKLDAELKSLKERQDNSLSHEIAELEMRVADITKRSTDATSALRLLEYLRPTEPRAMALRDQPEPEDCAINIRGSARQLGPVVPRGFVRVMMPSDRPAFFKQGASGRLELANWIARPDHPLTARVFVNRAWHHLFGAGIVRTVDNFGVRGEPPSHPELLDHLAVQFVKDGWSLKKLVRAIVLSQAYQQSSAHHARAFAQDPDNRLLWRSNRRRLDAESLRDALLAVSGRLSPGTGGPTLPLHLAGNVNLGKPEFIKDDPAMEDSVLNLRSIYQPVKRKNPFDKLDLLAVFDFPEPNDETGQRNVTTVPTQALYLMNAPLLRETAAATVKRVTRAGGDDDSRLRALYRLVLNREAEPDEIARRRQFLDRFEREHFTEREAAVGDGAPSSRDDSRTAAWEALVHGLLASNLFLFLE